MGKDVPPQALLTEGQIYEVTLQSKRQQKLIDEQHTMLKIPSGSFMQHIWQWLGLSRAAEVRVQDQIGRGRGARVARHDHGDQRSGPWDA